MLELRDVSLFVGQGSSVHALLADVSTRFPQGHFAAVIGPSGCGKSTLLKTVAGIGQGEEEGDIFWKGRDLSEDDFAPSEIGYVPQFSIAHDELTVFESVDTAMKLRVSGRSAEAREEAVDKILDEVGLLDFSGHRVQILSGGQKRRLSLAMEVVSKPAILLCDEVTSGLDPQSEDEIVLLLRELSRHDKRLVISVTHSLQHLELYDSVVVLYQGVLAYHGPAGHVAHYFRVDDATGLYRQLEQRKPEEWAKSWRKHRANFQEAMILEDSAEEITEIDFSSEEPSEEETELLEAELKEDSAQKEEAELKEKEKAGRNDDEAAHTPGMLTQFAVLFSRRVRIFFRNPAQLWLQLGLIFGFPVLVAVFAWNGLPNVQNLNMSLDQNVVDQLVEAKEFTVQAFKTGSLVSGIVMFQVILLTLMGANNAGREIAAERMIFEKEKLGGVSPLSFVASKVAFIFLLVTLQSVWMGLFVHFVCGFPGPIFEQLVFLWLVNAAMSMICLALSAWLGSAEQASLASIYLVGFQLPLSGAVLALPDTISMLTKPFIAAYWSWSGVLQTLRGERYYEIVSMVSQTALSPAALCFWVLFFHIIIGILLAWQGCQRSRLA